MANSCVKYTHYSYDSSAKKAEVKIALNEKTKSDFINFINGYISVIDKYEKLNDKATKEKEDIVKLLLTKLEEIREFAELTGNIDFFDKAKAALSTESGKTITKTNINTHITHLLRLFIAIQLTASFYPPTGNTLPVTSDEDIVTEYTLTPEEQNALTLAYNSTFIEQFINEILAIKEVSDFLKDKVQLKKMINAQSFAKRLQVEVTKQADARARIIEDVQEMRKFSEEQEENLIAQAELALNMTPASIQQYEEYKKLVSEKIQSALIDLKNQIKDKKKVEDYYSISLLYGIQLKLEKRLQEIQDNEALYTFLKQQSQDDSDIRALLLQKVLEASSTQAAPQSSFAFKLGSEVIAEIKVTKDTTEQVSVKVKYKSEDSTHEQIISFSKGNIAALLNDQNGLMKVVDDLNIFELYSKQEESKLFIDNQALTNNIIVKFYPSNNKDQDAVKTEVLYKAKQQGKITSDLFDGKNVNGVTLKGDGVFQIRLESFKSEWNEPLTDSIYTKFKNVTTNSSPYTIYYVEGDVELPMATILVDLDASGKISNSQGREIISLINKLNDSGKHELQELTLTEIFNSSWSDTLYGQKATTVKELKQELEKDYKVSNVYISRKLAEDSNKVDKVNVGRPFIAAFPKNIEENPNDLVFKYSPAYLRKHYGATIYYLSWPTVSVTALKTALSQKVFQAGINNLADPTSTEGNADPFNYYFSNEQQTQKPTTSKFFSEEIEEAKKIHEVFIDHGAGRRAVVDKKGEISPAHQAVGLNGILGQDDIFKGLKTNETENNKTYGTLDWIFQVLVKAGIFAPVKVKLIKLSSNLTEETLPSSGKLGFSAEIIENDPYKVVYRDVITVALPLPTSRDAVKTKTDLINFLNKTSSQTLDKTTILSGGLVNGQLTAENFIEGVDFVIEYGFRFEVINELFGSSGVFASFNDVSLSTKLTNVFNNFNIRRTAIPYGRVLQKNDNGQLVPKKTIYRIPILKTARKRRVLPGFSYVDTTNSLKRNKITLGSYVGLDAAFLFSFAHLVATSIPSLNTDNLSKLNINLNVSQQALNEVNTPLNDDTKDATLTELGIGNTTEESSILAPQRAKVIMPTGIISLAAGLSSTVNTKTKELNKEPTLPQFEEEKLPVTFSVTLDKVPTSTDENSDENDLYNMYHKSYFVEKTEFEDAVNMIEERLGKSAASKTVLAENPYVKGMLGLYRKGVIHLTNLGNRSVDYFTVLHEIMHASLDALSDSVKDQIYYAATLVPGIDKYVHVQDDSGRYLTAAELYEQRNYDELEEAMSRFYSFHADNYSSQSLSERINNTRKNKYKNLPKIIKDFFEYIDTLFRITERSMKFNRFEELMFNLESGKFMEEYEADMKSEEFSARTQESVLSKDRYNIQEEGETSTEVVSLEQRILNELQINPLSYHTLKDKLKQIIIKQKHNVAERLKAFHELAEDTTHITKLIESLNRNLENLRSQLNNLRLKSNIGVVITLNKLELKDSEGNSSTIEVISDIRTSTKLDNISASDPDSRVVILQAGLSYSEIIVKVAELIRPAAASAVNSLMQRKNALQDKLNSLTTDIIPVQVITKQATIGKTAVNVTLSTYKTKTGFNTQVVVKKNIDRSIVTEFEFATDVSDPQVVINQFQKENNRKGLTLGKQTNVITNNLKATESLLSPEAIQIQNEIKHINKRLAILSKLKSANNLKLDRSLFNDLFAKIKVIHEELNESRVNDVSSFDETEITDSEGNVIEINSTVQENVIETFLTKLVEKFDELQSRIANEENAIKTLQDQINAIQNGNAHESILTGTKHDLKNAVAATINSDSSLALFSTKVPINEDEEMSLLDLIVEELEDSEIMLSDDIFEPTEDTDNTENFRDISSDQKKIRKNKLIDEYLSTFFVNGVTLSRNVIKDSKLGKFIDALILDFISQGKKVTIEDLKKILTKEKFQSMITLSGAENRLLHELFDKVFNIDNPYSLINLMNLDRSNKANAMIATYASNVFNGILSYIASIDRVDHMDVNYNRNTKDLTVRPYSILDSVSKFVKDLKYALMDAFYTSNMFHSKAKGTFKIFNAILEGNLGIAVENLGESNNSTNYAIHFSIKRKEFNATGSSEINLELNKRLLELANLESQKNKNELKEDLISYVTHLISLNVFNDKNGLPVLVEILEEARKSENESFAVSLLFKYFPPENIQIASIGISIGANKEHSQFVNYSRNINPILSLPSYIFKSYFPEYKGGNNPDERLDFITRKISQIVGHKQITEESLRLFNAEDKKAYITGSFADFAIVLLDIASRFKNGKYTKGSSTPTSIPQEEYSKLYKALKNTKFIPKRNKVGDPTHAFNYTVTSEGLSEIENLAKNLQQSDHFTDDPKANILYFRGKVFGERMISRTSLAFSNFAEKFDELLAKLNSRRTADTVKNHTSGINLLVRQPIAYISHVFNMITNAGQSNTENATIKDLRPAVYNNFSNTGGLKLYNLQYLSVLHDSLRGVFKDIISLSAIERLRILYKLGGTVEIEGIGKNVQISQTLTRSDKTMQSMTAMSGVPHIFQLDSSIQLSIEDASLTHQGKTITKQKIVATINGVKYDIYYPQIVGGKIVNTYNEDNLAKLIQSKNPSDNKTDPKAPKYIRNTFISSLLFETMTKMEGAFELNKKLGIIPANAVFPVSIEQINDKKIGKNEFDTETTIERPGVKVTINLATGPKIITLYNENTDFVLTKEIITDLTTSLAQAIDGLGMSAANPFNLDPKEYKVVNGKITLNTAPYLALPGDETVQAWFVKNYVFEPIVGGAAYAQKTLREFVAAVTSGAASNFTQFVNFMGQENYKSFMTTFLETSHPVLFWAKFEDTVKRGIWNSTRGQVPSPIPNIGNINPMALPQNMNILTVEDAVIQDDNDENNEHTLNTVLKALENEVGDDQLNNGQIFQNPISQMMEAISRGEIKDENPTHKKHFLGAFLRKAGVFMNKASTFTITNEYLNNGTKKAHAILFASLGGLKSPIAMMWNYYRYNMIIEAVANAMGDNNTVEARIAALKQQTPFRQGAYYHPSQFKAALPGPVFDKLMTDFNAQKDWKMLFTWMTSQHTVGDQKVLGRNMTEAQFAEYVQSLGHTYTSPLTGAQVVFNQSFVDSATMGIEDIFMAHKVTTPSSTKLGGNNTISQEDLVRGDANMLTLKRVTYPSSHLIEILPFKQGVQNESMKAPNQVKYIVPSTQNYDEEGELALKKGISFFKNAKNAVRKAFIRLNETVLVSAFFKSDELKAVIDKYKNELGNKDNKELLEEFKARHTGKVFSILDNFLAANEDIKIPDEIREEVAKDGTKNQVIVNKKLEIQKAIQKAYDEFIEKQYKEGYYMTQAGEKVRYKYDRLAFIKKAVADRMKHIDEGALNIQYFDLNLPITANHAANAGLAKGQQVSQSTVPGFRAVNNTTNNLVKVFELTEDIDVFVPELDDQLQPQIVNDKPIGNTFTLKKGTVLTTNMAMRYGLYAIDESGNNVPSSELQEKSNYRNMSFYRIKKVNKSGEFMGFVSDLAYSFYLYAGQKMRGNKYAALSDLIVSFAESLSKDGNVKNLQPTQNSDAIAAYRKHIANPAENAATEGQILQAMAILNDYVSQIETEFGILLGTFSNTGFVPHTLTEQEATQKMSVVLHAKQLIKVVASNPAFKVAPAETMISSKTFAKLSGLRRMTKDAIRSLESYTEALIKEAVNQLYEQYQSFEFYIKNINNLKNNLTIYSESFFRGFIVAMKNAEKVAIKDSKLNELQITSLSFGVVLKLLQMNAKGQLESAFEDDKIQLFSIFADQSDEANRVIYTKAQVAAILNYVAENGNTVFKDAHAKYIKAITAMKKATILKENISAIGSILENSKYDKTELKSNFQLLLNAHDEALKLMDIPLKIVEGQKKAKEGELLLLSIAANKNSTSFEYFEDLIAVGVGALESSREINKKLDKELSFYEASKAAILQVIKFQNAPNSTERIPALGDSGKANILRSKITKQAKERYPHLIDAVNNIIGIRIPTSGVNSVQLFEAIDFIDNSENTMFNTDVINFVAGSDNDGDMLSLILKAFKDFYDPMNKQMKKLMSEIVRVIEEEETVKQAEEREFRPLKLNEFQESVKEVGVDVKLNNKGEQHNQRRFHEAIKNAYSTLAMLPIASSLLNMKAFAALPAFLKVKFLRGGDIISNNISMEMNQAGKFYIGPMVKNEEARNNYKAHAKKIRKTIKSLNESKKQGNAVVINKLINFLEKFISKNAKFTLNGVQSSITNQADFLRVSSSPKALSDNPADAILVLTDTINSLTAYESAFRESLENTQKTIDELSKQKNLNFEKAEDYNDALMFEEAIKKELNALANSKQKLVKLVSILETSTNTTESLNNLSGDLNLALNTENYRIIVDNSHGPIIMLREYTDNGQRSEAGVNVSLDNAKNPVLSFWNFSLAVSPLVNALNITGISSVEEFFQNPFIKELTTELNESKEILGFTRDKVTSLKGMLVKLQNKAKNISVLKELFGDDAVSVSGASEDTLNSSTTEGYDFKLQSIEKLITSVKDLLTSSLKESLEIYDSVIVAEVLKKYENMFNDYNEYILKRKELITTIKTLQNKLNDIKSEKLLQNPSIIALKRQVLFLRSKIYEIESISSISQKELNNLKDSVTELTNTSNALVKAYNIEESTDYSEDSDEKTIQSILSELSNIYKNENSGILFSILSKHKEYLSSIKDFFTYIETLNEKDETKPIASAINNQIKTNVVVKQKGQSQIEAIAVREFFGQKSLMDIITMAKKLTVFNDAINVHVTEALESISSYGKQEIHKKFKEILQLNSITLPFSPPVDPVTGKITDAVLELNVYIEEVVDGKKVTTEKTKKISVKLYDLYLLNTYLNLAESFAISEELGNLRELVKMMSKSVKNNTEYFQLLYGLKSALNLTVLTIPNGILSKYELELIDRMPSNIEKALMQRLLLVSKIDQMSNVVLNVVDYESNISKIKEKNTNAENSITALQTTVSELDKQIQNITESLSVLNNEKAAKILEIKNENLDKNLSEAVLRSMFTQKSKENKELNEKIAKLTLEKTKAENKLKRIYIQIEKLKGLLEANDKVLVSLEQEQKQSENITNIFKEQIDSKVFDTIRDFLSSHLIRSVKTINPYLFLYNKKVLNNLKNILLMQAELNDSNLIINSSQVKEILLKKFERFKYVSSDTVAIMQKNITNLVFGLFLNKYPTSIDNTTFLYGKINTYAETFIAYIQENTSLKISQEEKENLISNVQVLLDKLKSLNPNTVSNRIEIVNITADLYSEISSFVRNLPSTSIIENQVIALGNIVTYSPAMHGIKELAIASIEKETVMNAQRSMNSLLGSDDTKLLHLVNELLLVHSMYSTGLNLSYRNIAGLVPTVFIDEVSDKFSSFIDSTEGSLEKMIDKEKEIVNKILDFSISHSDKLSEKVKYGTESMKKIPEKEQSTKNPENDAVESTENDMFIENQITEELLSIELGNRSLPDVEFGPIYITANVANRLEYIQTTVLSTGNSAMQVIGNMVKDRILTQLEAHKVIQDIKNIEIPMGNKFINASTIKVDNLPNLIKVPFRFIIKTPDVKDDVFQDVKQLYTKVVKETDGIVSVSYVAVKDPYNFKINSMGTIDTAYTGIVPGMDEYFYKVLGNTEQNNSDLNKILSDAIGLNITEEQKEQQKICNIN